MHALIPAEGTGYYIYFGGSYQEHWSDDYSLSVTYSDRRCVRAEYRGGEWTAAGGDEELCAALTSPEGGEHIKRYFRAAADVYSSSRECVRKGIPLERLYEQYHTDEPFAAAELMRLLMDDCGFSLETAYRVTVRCCDVKVPEEDGMAALEKMQPRTARVAALLEDARTHILDVEHDGSRKEYRDPPRALRCGESFNTAVRVLGGAVDRAYMIVFGDRLRREYPMERVGSVFSLSVSSPEEPAALWYAFRLETPEGEYYLCPDETQCAGELCRTLRAGFRLTVFRSDFQTPEWFRHAVMYQIFPDRFAFSDDGTAERGIEYHRALGQHGELHASLDEPLRWQPRPFENSYVPDDFFGGTLKGIESKLPYLQELGVSCIYLNPVFESSSNHRYDTSDYMKIDPILGDEEDFARLSRSAAERGMRIILDGVFSHTGADSIYFNRYGNYPSVGACQGESSEYYAWYDFRHFPDDYRCWWGFKDLPEVDETEPAWQEKIISGEQSVVKTWLRRGASGWRLDVADELPDSALALIRQAVKQTDPDAPIIGEVWEDAVIKESYGGRRNYALGYSLDSVMNYPLRSAILDFTHRRTDARALRDFLKAQRMNYPEPMYYSLMNLLGSHDVERLLSALATDVVIKQLPREAQLRIHFDEQCFEKARELEKLCAALQFALPGVPSIYYGDEQGMRGVGDPFNRGVFKESDGDLHKFYVNLSLLRRSDPVFAEGKAEFFAPSSDILLVLRYFDSCGSVFLTAINRGVEESFCADLSCAGIGFYQGRIGECSSETIRLR